MLCGRYVTKRYAKMHQLVEGYDYYTQRLHIFSWIFFLLFMFYVCEICNMYKDSFIGKIYFKHFLRFLWVEFQYNLNFTDRELTYPIDILVSDNTSKLVIMHFDVLYFSVPGDINLPLSCSGFVWHYTPCVLLKLCRAK